MDATDENGREFNGSDRLHGLQLLDLLNGQPQQRLEGFDPRGLRNQAPEPQRSRRFLQ